MSRPTITLDNEEVLEFGITMAGLTQEQYDEICHKQEDQIRLSEKQRLYIVNLITLTVYAWEEMQKAKEDGKTREEYIEMVRKNGMRGLI